MKIFTSMSMLSYAKTSAAVVASCVAYTKDRSFIVSLQASIKVCCISKKYDTKK